MTELKAKRLARIRDGGKCLICKRSGAFTLHGHHVWPKSLFPSLSTAPTNIATLCLPCHLGLVHGSRIADGGEPNGRWRDWVLFLDTERARHE